MSALDTMSRRDLQRKAKEYGVKVRVKAGRGHAERYEPVLTRASVQANSSSDLIREQLKAKGFDLGPRRRRPVPGWRQAARSAENDSQSFNSGDRTRSLTAELRSEGNPVEIGTTPQLVAPCACAVGRGRFLALRFFPARAAVP